MDKKFFIEILEGKDVDIERSKEYWDGRAEKFYEYTRNNDNDSSIEFLKEFIDLKDKSVLDVGFGAGKYLKLFSEEGSNLSGVELSDEMVRYAKKHCMENGINIDEIDIYNMPWEDIDLDQLGWNNKFDLVFASKSPALNSYESIKKLIRASKKGVFFSSHIYMDEDIFSKLYKEIKKEEYQSKRNRFWSIYNILYLEGYYPNMKVEHRENKTKFTSDELVKRYSYRLFDENPSEGDLIRLKASIERHEIHGKVTVNMERKDVLMYFQV